MGSSRGARSRRPTGEWWKSNGLSAKKTRVSPTKKMTIRKFRSVKDAKGTNRSCNVDATRKPNGMSEEAITQNLRPLLPVSKSQSEDEEQAATTGDIESEAGEEYSRTPLSNVNLVQDALGNENEIEKVLENDNLAQAQISVSRSHRNTAQRKDDVTRNSRRNRGRGNSSIPLQRLDRDTLLTREDLIMSANSNSTKANVARARTVLSKFAAKHRASDPKDVTPNSSLLVMNAIAFYCNFGNLDALKNDAMGSLIQGLRIVYEEHGHTTAWSVCDGRAYGNPLIENRDITRLRRAHRINLAKHGVQTVRARPLTAAIVCDHAEKYWFKNNDEDVLLHAIFVLGLHLGLRYDEVSKLELKFLSVTSDSITLRTSLGVKNQTGQRSYKLDEWPGDTPLRGSLFMDPKVALLSWLTVRGSAEGFVFCDVYTGNHGFCKINTSKALSAARFTSMMRKRLLTIGIGPGDAGMYSAHSLKRGSVQLYRSLGLRDEYIMQKVQMVGPRAYATYCAAYNDCAPNDLPRFASAEEYIQHASRLMGERNLLLNDEAYENFLAEVIGVEESSR